MKEYMIDDVSVVLGAGHVERQLDRSAEDGWRLVAVVPIKLGVDDAKHLRHYFEREKYEAPADPVRVP